MPPILATAALAAGFALQPTGTFHGDEPVARDGERWLALVARPDGRQALVAAPVVVRRVHDAIADAEGEATGLDVQARDLPDASLLLRGPGLRAGALEPARLLAPADGASATDFGAFVFRGATWRLRADCRDAVAVAADDGSRQSCDLVLEQGLARQVLQSIERVRQADGGWMFGDDAGPALLQAGDFDRDGRPDLILDLTDHYNVSRPVLFLSGAARGGELVRRVAGYESVGC